MIVAASNCLTAIQARWIGAIRVVRQKRTGKAVHGRGARFGGERRFTWGIRRYGVCSEVEIKSYVFIKNYHHVLNGVVVAESDCANEAMGATCNGSQCFSSYNQIHAGPVSQILFPQRWRDRILGCIGNGRYPWGARYMQRKRGHPAGRDTLNPDSSARQPGKAQGRQRPWGALKRAYSSWNKWSNSKLPCGLRGSQCCLETTEDT